MRLGSTRGAWWLAALTLVALGLALRLQQFDEQVLGGDELHAIHAARDHTLLEAFTYYSRAENSIPLTVWARALMETVGLTELRFRLPAMAAGIGLLLAPLLLRRRLGRATALVALGLVATTPLAVYYSLVIRPYAPAAILLLAALAAWDRWMRRGSGRALAVFVVMGALSVFFHLLCLFPLGWLVILTLVAVRRGTLPFSAALQAVAWLLAAGLALLGPGLPGLIEVRLMGSTRPAAGTLPLAWEAFVMIAGSRESVAISLLVLAAVGSVRLVRRDAWWGMALAGLAPAVLAGMLITQAYPAPTAWARYLFLAWIPLLLLAAHGAMSMAWLLARWLRGHALRAAGGVVLGAVAISVWTAVQETHETNIQRVLPWMGACIVLAASAQALAGRLAGTTGGPRAGARGARALSALLAGLLAAGTLAWTPYPILRLGGHDSFRARRAATNVLTRDRRQGAARGLPDFLKKIADQPDIGDVVLVWPYRTFTRLWQPLAALQDVLGRRIVMVHERTVKTLEEQGVHFQNVTDLGRASEWAERGARYLVLLRDLVERPAAGTAGGAETVRLLGVLPVPNDGTRTFVDAGYFATLGPILRRRFGEPVHTDESILVYDVRPRP